MSQTEANIFITCEEDRVLGDDGDPWPELPEAQDSDVDAIYLDGAARGLDDPEEGEGERGLAGPCPSHNPDLLHALNVTVNTLKNQIQTRSVPCLCWNKI